MNKKEPIFWNKMNSLDDKGEHLYEDDDEIEEDEEDDDENVFFCN